MPTCKCGCGGETRRGKFRPGHDQKLRAKLENMAGEGGLLNLAALVEVDRDYAEARINLEPFGQRIRAIFAKDSQTINV